jgi:dTDP-4-amino-4,6-dideoxygalactose transaminase
MSFEVIKEFENKIAEFFGSPYAVAVDCCTHGIELCLRYIGANKLIVPKRTYLSIPFLSNKLNIPLEWKDENWKDYYEIGDTGIYDAAVLWGKNSYIPETFMCLSFQFQKHLSLGRGGMILTDSDEAKDELKKMSYDGRLPDEPWREQNISTMGYHYYMTPETAQNGLDKLEEAKNTKQRKWVIEDWPDLTKMEVFK